MIHERLYALSHGGNPYWMYGGKLMEEFEQRLFAGLDQDDVVGKVKRIGGYFAQRVN